MSELPERNGWSIARHAGDWTPDKTQRRLNHAVWDTFAAMGMVRRFAVPKTHYAPAAARRSIHADPSPGRRRTLQVQRLHQSRILLGRQARNLGHHQDRRFQALSLTWGPDQMLSARALMTD